MKKRSPFARMRSKRREVPTVELSLAAMVDMMINLLIFLLHLYGRGALVETSSDDLELAESSAEEPLQISVGVVVSRVAVEVDGERVVELDSDETAIRLPEGLVEQGAIPGLTDALGRALAAEQARAKARDPNAATEAQLLVQTDRRVPWSVLGPVLRSGAAAGAQTYRFVVASTAER